MMNEKMISEALLLCQNKRKAVQAMTQVLTDWDSNLEQEETALRTLTQVGHEGQTFEKRFREAQLRFPGMGLPSSMEVIFSTRPKRRKTGKKQDVQIIEEIFLEYGPLHVTDLVPVGQSRGVSFKGSKKPTLMARDKMVGSKRFRLFGKNVWGLPNQELPNRYIQNGHQREQPGLIEVR